MKLLPVTYILNLAILFIHNYYDKNSLDFAIRVTPNSTSLFKALFFMSEQAHWKTASIHYVVTSREDLRAGTVTVPDSTNLLLLPEENGELAITHYLNERPWQVKSDRIKIHCSQLASFPGVPDTRLRVFSVQ